MTTIEQPTITVELTREQLQMLGEYQSRLANLQNEIKITTTQLKEVSNDTSRITKEKIYQEEMLEKVNSNVKEAQSKVDKLNEQALEVGATLASINSEIATKKISLADKDAEFKEREEFLVKKEEEVFEGQERISQKELEVDEKEQRLNRKINILNEVLSQI